jgi:hypothetical protein
MQPSENKLVVLAYTWGQNGQLLVLQAPLVGHPGNLPRHPGMANCSSDPPVTDLLELRKTHLGTSRAGF